jgi:hypothetical protein
MFALINTADLEQRNQLMVKQLKNRYNDPTLYKKFVIGVDRAKMRLYSVEESAQADIIDDAIFDKSRTGQSNNSEKKKKFGDLLV